MEIKVESKLIINEDIFRVGDIVELTSKYDNVIEGKIVAIHNYKMAVEPKYELYYWVEFDNIKKVIKI